MPLLSDFLAALRGLGPTQRKKFMPIESVSSVSSSQAAYQQLIARQSQQRAETSGSSSEAAKAADAGQQADRSAVASTVQPRGQADRDDTQYA
jgi:hypothetical protein